MLISFYVGKAQAEALRLQVEDLRYLDSKDEEDQWVHLVEVTPCLLSVPGGREDMKAVAQGLLDRVNLLDSLAEGHGGHDAEARRGFRRDRDSLQGLLGRVNSEAYGSRT